MALRPLGSIHGGGNPATVGLTFDDGPDPVWTMPLLDLLDERSTRATFFVLAGKAKTSPQVVREIVQRGHEIALHGLDHTRLTTLSLKEVGRRTRGAKALVEDVAGTNVRWFRPPYGAQSLSIYGVLRACGLEVVVWGPTARDWVDGSPADVAARALGPVMGRDIVLLHDGLEVMPGDVMPTFDRTAMFTCVLDGFAARGLTGVPIGELAAAGHLRRTAWFRP